MTTANSPVLVQKERLDELKTDLVRTLREMFQIDSPGLNFGMYRIMNQRRGEIERFLQEDLVACVDAEFGRYDEELAVSIEKDRVALERVITEEIADDALTERGIAGRYLVTKRAKELQGQWEDLQRREREMSMSDVQKAEVFGHLTEFFSRYYEDGDFLSLRRYSREGKYAIPYNGEEVLLHWANKDQYYVKSDAFLRGHGFDAGEVHVVFEVVDSEETPNTGKKKTKLVVVPCGEENEVEYFAEENTLIIRFARRYLTTDERKEMFPPKGDAEGITAHLLKSSHIPAELRKKLAGEKDDPSKPEILKQHVAAFTKESTSDFFIHKDLGKFLRGELDFYIKNEVFRLDDLSTDEEVKVELFVRRAKILKTVGERIISFLAQLEDFQKMLWEKKKFVFRSEYCITVDHIPEEFYAEICANEQQMAEWRRLYALDDAGPKTKKGQETLFAQEMVVFDADFLETHPFVMVDTAFFPPEFKDRLLEHLVNPKTGDPVDDLDEATGGLMIHSENWQALNLLQERYRELVKCVYIDPPYNIGNDGFYYRDNYKDSCWASMMYDRLSAGKTLMADNSVIFSSIDDGEQALLRTLMSSVFGEQNFINNVIWQKKYSPANDTRWLSDGHDFLITYAKDKSVWRPGLLPRTEKSIKRDYKNPDNDPRGLWKSGDLSAKTYSASGDYAITTPSGRIVSPPKGACWRVNQEKFQEMVADNRIWFGEDGSNVPAIKRFLTEVKNGVTPMTIWEYDDVGHTQEGKKRLIEQFSTDETLTSEYLSKTTPKPVRLLSQVILVGDKDLNGCILDFFAGTGGTALATLAQNRKPVSVNQNIPDDEIPVVDAKWSDEKICPSRNYILVELSDVFTKLLKPRVEKFVYSDSWKNGIPQNTDGQSHIFKYMELEQYEDTLDNIAFRDQDRTIQVSLFSSNDYLLNYSLDFETKESSCRLNVQTMKTPFSYNLRTRRENGFEDVAKDADGFRTLTVDLVETFNYLLGLHVEKRAARQNNGNTYRIIHGKTRNEKQVTIIWRNCPETPEGHTKDLEEDAAFISQTLLPAFPCDTLYVNGHCFVATAKPIEPIFKKLMGA